METSYRAGALLLRPHAAPWLDSFGVEAGRVLGLSAFLALTSCPSARPALPPCPTVALARRSVWGFGLRQGANRVIQAAGGGLRSPRSEPGVPPVPVDRTGQPPEYPSWADRRFWDVVPLRDAVLSVTAVLVVVGGALAGYYVRSVLGPVLVSLIVAYLFNPPMTALERRRVPRSVSAGVLAALVVAAEVVIVFWLGPLLAKQTVAVTRELPRAVRQVSRQIERKYDVETAPLTEPIEQLAPSPGERKLDVASGLRTLRWAIGGNYYRAPNRIWNYDSSFNNVANLPPFAAMAVTAVVVCSW